MHRYRFSVKGSSLQCLFPSFHHPHPSFKQSLCCVHKCLYVASNRFLQQSRMIVPRHHFRVETQVKKTNLEEEDDIMVKRRKSLLSPSESVCLSITSTRHMSIKYTLCSCCFDADAEISSLTHRGKPRCPESLSAS